MAMNEFLKVLTHGRRLQGAVKDLSVEELETVAEKLANIIENRKTVEAQRRQKDAEKQSKLAAIMQQLDDAGLDLTDLTTLDDLQKGKSSGKKRPVKYRIIDEQGEPRDWSGVGRMPKVFVRALENGKHLDDYLV